MPLSPKNIRRIFLYLFIPIIGLLAILWATYQIWLSTIHVVIPSQVYRSAQLTSPILHHYIRTKEIKTVINLRGAQQNAKWYKKEIAMTTELGAIHYDISLGSHQIPIKEKMRMLVYLLLHAPRPILVHCLGGADRSGLASAVALILYKNAPLAESEQQISVEHLVLSPRSIGKLVFPYYQQWLMDHHLSHNRENFLKWVCSPYPFDHTATYHYAKKLDNYNPCPQLGL